MSGEVEKFIPKEVFKFTVPHEFTQNWVKSRKPGWSMTLKPFQLEVDGIVTRWHVEVFPNGTGEDSRDHMSVFLVLRSASSNNFFARIFARIFNIKFKNSLKFNAKFVLGIVARHGTIVYDKNFTCCGEDFDDACGSHDFITHERLFKKENHIPDKKLTVSCEISLSKTAKTPKPTPPLTAQIDYKKLFKTKSDSDLKLLTNEGKTIKVHKEVLVKKCPDFFLAINWSNNTGVEADFNYKTINEFLRFAYYGEVENLKKIAGDLLKAARKYKMIELEKICVNQIATL